MNPQEIQQVTARDEKWVPSAERVKISSTNLRLEATVPQKEETFQVVIDIIKNSTCFKAFTISVDVPEIFMQQVDAEVFRKILNIYPRVECEEFIKLQNDEDTPTFLIDLGYKAVRVLLDVHQVFHWLDSPKNSRGKGSQGKKTIDDSQETVDVSEESEPEPVKRKTASRRVVKKKVTISVDDNIILDPNVALELGKSISLAEAEEEEAAKQVHATHATIMTESAEKNTVSRSSRSVVIQDTPSSPKPKPITSKPTQRCTRGSSEGTGTIPGVPDESTVVSATSHEGTRSEQVSEYSEEDQLDDEEKDDKEYDVDNEGVDQISDTQDTDDEDDETESDEDEIYKYKIRVRKDKDEEMLNAKVEDSKKRDAEVFDAAKADAEKTEEAKDDSKKAELPLTSSSLSIYLGFGDQFLKLSSNTSLVGTVKDTTDSEIGSLLDIKIQSEVPHIQSLSVLRVPIYVIYEPIVLTPVQETSSAALVITLRLPSVSTTPPVPQQTTTPIPTPPITTDAPIITIVVPESNTLTIVQLRVAKLEKDVSELKKIDHSAKALATLKSQVPTVVEQYLGSKIGDDLQKQDPDFNNNLEQESEKSALEILKIKKEQAEKQKMRKYTIKSIDMATLKEYDQNSALYQTMHENKSFNRNPANHRFYHALMEALIEDKNAMDKGVADTIKDHKRKHDDDDDDDDPPAGLNQGKKIKRRRTKESESSKKPSSTKEIPKGKAPSKGSKTGKSASAKEPVKEPITEVVMDDAGENVVHDDDQPQDTSEPKKATTPNLE
ncbi:hypothetical protein Tco_0878518 [Tanacetum coccineum]|uniref:Uncharacterized protein n=1 Tax=Tanacetum coccineum TaxID=301880 RepID=A0ABQ5C1E6_9ASTR